MAAVIGHPIQHSRSPAIFSFLAELLRVSEFSYQALDISPADLKEFFNSHQARPEWLGVNVTIPHKESAAQLVDESSPEATATRAVNMIHFQGGRAKGFNTDVLGLREVWRRQQLNPQGKTVLILGAGGAARAAAFAVSGYGPTGVVICNRNLARANNLVDEFKILFPLFPWSAVDWEFDFPSIPIDLVIQATSMGMSGGGGAPSQNLKAIFLRVLKGQAHPQRTAMDLVYTPERTEFLQCAAANSYQTISGLGMLVYQALATWEIWFGQLEKKDHLADQLTAYLSAHGGL